jgi:hypothetical protein
MKSKFIKLFPWSVALLFFGVSLYYWTMLQEAGDRINYYKGQLQNSLLIMDKQERRYDSVVKLTQTGEGYFKDIILDSSQPGRVISSPNSTIVLGNANKVNVKN